MAMFLPALERALKWEGGYSNDPQDPGGETALGVSRRANPKWIGWEYLPEWRRDPKSDGGRAFEREVSALYLLSYWEPIWGYKIKSQALADVVFSIAINIGTGRAIEHLYLSCGVGLPAKRMRQDVLDIANRLGDVVVNRYCDLIADYYRSLNKPRFEKGWLNRINSYRLPE